MLPYKNGTLCKKNAQRLYLPMIDLNDFKRKFLNLFYDSDSWSVDFKVEFFPLQSDTLTTVLCLIVGVVSINRVLNR